MRANPSRIALWLVFIVGALGAAIFGWYAVQDFAALRVAYARFERLASTHASYNALFVAEAMQNAHRINLFADGVWSLLAAILAAIGLHGLSRTTEAKIVR